MKTITADEIREVSYVYGRSLGEKGPIALDWSASGIRFGFKGPGEIIASFSFSMNSYATHFAVEIDGAFSHYVEASSSAPLVSLKDDKTHEIRIYKTSEAPENMMNLDHFLVSDGASLSKPRPNKGYKIEIIGDSLTCGNQYDINNPSLEDAYQSYATLLGKAYGDDFSLVSVSGRGLMEGWDSAITVSRNYQMKDLWHKTSFFRDPDASWTPREDTDVVIVGLGSNDLDPNTLKKLGTSIDDFLPEVVKFQAVLRKAYPKAKIIFAFGVHMNQTNLEKYRDCVERIDDDDTFFVQLPSLQHGAMGHPDPNDHDILAEVMSKSLSKILGIPDPYIPRFEHPN